MDGLRNISKFVAITVPADGPVLPGTVLAKFVSYIDGLVQGSCYSSALARELTSFLH